MVFSEKRSCGRIITIGGSGFNPPPTINEEDNYGKEIPERITGDEARMVAIKYPWSENQWYGFVSQEDKKPKATYKAGSKNCSSKKAGKMLFSKKTPSVMSILITPRLLLCTR